MTWCNLAVALLSERHGAVVPEYALIRSQSCATVRMRASPQCGHDHFRCHCHSIYICLQGSLADVREELRFAVTQPIRHPDRYAALGLQPAAGVLLYGPPGCGKTLVAQVRPGPLRVMARCCAGHSAAARRAWRRRAACLACL